MNLLSKFPIVAACLLTFAVSTAHAQPSAPEPRPSDTVEEYVVKAGDTLSNITEDVLGTSFLWRENWRLNPQVRDPNLLKIGQRLRVITHRELPERTAEVFKVFRDVERQPPEAWEASHEGDVLQQDQALRTRSKSTAAVRFDDDTLLNLKEETLVVFREMGQSLRGVRTETIAVDYGTADLFARPARKGSSEIKVIVGDATTEVDTGPTGRNSSRLRRSRENTSSVMTYEGTSRVEANGQTVDVAAGMGTSVADGEVPSPPEPLLPAPLVPGSRRARSLSYSNPLLRWNAVPSAVSYTVEICSTAACERLVDQARGLKQTEYRPDSLPVGSLFWRARAVSATGLDGYASRVRQLDILSETADLRPPEVAVAAASLARATRADHFAVARGGALELRVTDDASGVATLEVRWGDEGTWTAVAVDAPVQLSPPVAEDLTLEIRARDAAEREMQRSVAVDFLPPPAPPTLRIRGQPRPPAANPP
ncbi:MAG: LysM domain-containing protein [Acidobacteriota bacterium]